MKLIDGEANAVMLDVYLRNSGVALHGCFVQQREESNTRLLYSLETLQALDHCLAGASEGTGMVLALSAPQRELRVPITEIAAIYCCRMMRNDLDYPIYSTATLAHPTLAGRDNAGLVAR